MELLFLFFFLAVVLSFICSILEAILLSTSHSYILAQVTQGKKGALLLQKNKEQIDLSISAILTVNTFANTLGASGVGAQAMVLFGQEYMFFASAILTLAILYLSEIIPKTIGALYWKKLAIPSAYVVRVLILITYPLLLISSLITGYFRKNAVTTTSREEIQAISDMGERDGVINEQEGDIIENLLNLQNYKVKDILTPRSVVFALKGEMKVGDFFSIKDFDTFSRIPIYEESLDRITGVVLLRHILIESQRGGVETKLGDLALPIMTIHENIHVSMALGLFIKRREHIFIVRDGFDQMQGVVTLEDAIETLLGVEIVDEFDSVADMQALAKLKARQKVRR